MMHDCGDLRGEMPLVITRTFGRTSTMMHDCGDLRGEMPLVITLGAWQTSASQAPDSRGQ